MKKIIRGLFVILMVCCSICGPVGAADEYNEEDDYLSDDDYLLEEETQDYLEPWNRLMFNFNDRLYFLVMKPVTEGYVFIAPVSFRLYISNFFSNLSFPVRFTNSLLQGKGDGAAVELWRFLVNLQF